MAADSTRGWAGGGSAGWGRGDWRLFGLLQVYRPAVLPWWRLLRGQNECWPVGKGSVAEDRRRHTVPAAFAWEFVPSRSSGCMVQIVGQDMVEERPGGCWYLECTCYCTLGVPEAEQLADIGPAERHSHIAAAAVAAVQLYGLELMLLVRLQPLVAYSELRLAVVAGSLEQVIG